MAKTVQKSLALIVACSVAFSFIIKETFCWQTVQLAANILCSVVGAVDPHPDKPNPGGGLPGGGDPDRPDDPDNPDDPDSPVTPDSPDAPGDEENPPSPEAPDETGASDTPQKPSKAPEALTPSDNKAPQSPAGSRGKTPFTGDNSRLGVWMSLMLISGIGIWMCILLLRKEKKGAPKYAKPGLYGWAFINRNMDKIENIENKIEKFKKITKKHLQNLP